MNRLNINVVEVICKRCGGYGVKIYPDNVNIDKSACICDCGNSGTLDEFILEIE